jgi:hypothetical protein
VRAAAEHMKQSSAAGHGLIVWNPSACGDGRSIYVNSEAILFQVEYTVCIARTLLNAVHYTKSLLQPLDALLFFSSGVKRQASFHWIGRDNFPSIVVWTGCDRSVPCVSLAVSTLAALHALHH